VAGEARRGERTNYSPKKLPTSVQRVEPTESPRLSELLVAFE